MGWEPKVPMSLTDNSQRLDRIRRQCSALSNPMIIMDCHYALAMHLSQLRLASNLCDVGFCLLQGVHRTLWGLLVLVCGCSERALGVEQFKVSYMRRYLNANSS